MLSNYPQLRYCKIMKGKKAPFEKDWTNKPYKWEEIQDHIKKETNYGVLCGHGNLAVIDSDNIELQKHIAGNLPATFRVRTGGGGVHNYYFVPGLKNKIILTTNLGDKEIHWGEVQSYGTQVVGVGSVHPNGKEYEILEPLVIAEITQEQLLAAVRPFMKEVQQSERASDWEKEKYGKKADIDSLNVAEIWGTVGLKAHGQEYYGSHPIHGSESGMNFWLNSSRNLWHCFRCNSGGGALSAIAVKEGLIDCSEAQKGLLRGASAIEAIKIAKERYGLKGDIKEGTIEKKKDFEIIWEKDLKDYEIEETEWVIDKIIPSRAVGVWTGKRGTLKTFMLLNVASCVANGKPFLGQFPVKEGKVIYLDKENGVHIMKQRMPLIKKGLEIEKSLEIGFICFSQLKINKVLDIAKIEEVIKEHKPSLFIVDTYRRGISFEENDAGEVSKLFVDILRPLVERNNLSIVLIHHDKKGESQGDEMDMIRGSSDLANYVDFILKNERRGEKLVLKQLKMRAAPEIKPLEVNIISNADSLIRFEYIGEHEIKSKDEVGSQIILDWIIKNRKSTFRTHEIKELSLREGIKETNFKYALNRLIDSGIILRKEKGVYEVIAKDAKLIMDG